MKPNSDQLTRQLHREKIFDCLLNYGAQTRRQIASKLGFDHVEVQRRLSELKTCDFIQTQKDKVSENGYLNSVYEVNKQRQLFIFKLPETKHQKVMSFLLTTHPEIHAEALKLL